jgi:hypothetical protein
MRISRGHPGYLSHFTPNSHHYLLFLVFARLILLEIIFLDMRQFIAYMLIMIYIYLYNTELNITTYGPMNMNQGQNTEIITMFGDMDMSQGELWYYYRIFNNIE